MALLSTEQAAERLGVTQVWVRAMIAKKMLPAQKVGRDWIIDEKDLAKLDRKPVGRPSKEKKPADGGI